MFLASPCLETCRFSNWSFCYFDQFKTDSHFPDFRQVKSEPTHLYLLTIWKITVILLSLGMMIGHKKFCSGCSRQIFFHLGTEKWLVVVLGRRLPYTVMIVWRFAWADSALVLCLCFRGGHLNMFNCNICVTNKMIK